MLNKIFGLSAFSGLLMVVGTGCGGHKTVVVTNPNPIYTSPGSSGGCSEGSVGSSGGCICPESLGGYSSGGCGPIIVGPISSGGSPGSSGGSPGSSGGNPDPQPTPVGPAYPVYPVSSGGYYNSGSSGSASVGGDTKDVDLQQAQLEQAQTEDKAQSMAQQFGMNLDAARQLTQISDKMAVLQAQANGMSDQDRASLADAALGVAGISGDQVNQAYAAYMNGDKNAVDNLVTQAAVNLGMPSTDGLRDQILPALGINLGQ